MRGLRPAFHATVVQCCITDCVNQPGFGQIPFPKSPARTTGLLISISFSIYTLVPSPNLRNTSPSSNLSLTRFVPGTTLVPSIFLSSLPLYSLIDCIWCEIPCALCTHAFQLDECMGLVHHPEFWPPGTSKGIGDRKAPEHLACWIFLI